MEATMKSWLKTIAVLFALPIFSLLFFTYAPTAESNRIRDVFISNLSNSTLSEEKRAHFLDFVREQNFETLCLEQPILAEQLGLSEPCKSFEYFDWTRIACIVLLALGALHLLLIAMFARLAQRSKTALLIAFKSAWAASIGFSLCILLGQTALLAATLFCITVILFSVYIPKLLVVVLFLGAYAFYRICRVMFERTEFSSHAKNAEEVSKEAAPRLWAEVIRVAQKLGTTPPDTIVVGMETSCYVTEAPVIHAQGTTQGRTLYLSAPIMQRLSADEMAAIIGHEMGHFSGEDTLTTRHLSPRLVKSAGTLDHLYQAWVVGWPAYYAMLAFHNLFAAVIAKYQRDREFAADTSGAYATSPRTAALALVRYCFESEIFDIALDEHMAKSVDFDSALAQHRNELLTNVEFWEALMNHGLPHPFDSHPPVKLRVEKLGYSVFDLRDDVTTPIEHSAFAEWLDSKAIANALSTHSQIVTHVQEQILVAQTPADELSKDIIDKHFPTIILKANSRRVLVYALKDLLVLGICVSIAMAFLFIWGQWWPMLIAPVAGWLGYLWFRLFRRYYGQTLTIDFRGVQLSSWSQPLIFSDMKSLAPLNEGLIINQLKMIFEMNEPISALYRKPLFFDIKRRAELKLYLFEGSAEQTSETIIRYSQRGLAD